MGNISKIIFCALLLMVMTWTDAWADDAVSVPGASSQDLLQWLERDSAELRAARHEAASAQQRADAAGTLPDPSLRLEWMDINRNNPSLSPSQAGTMKYTWLQPLPGWGKRDAQKQAATADAAVARQQQRAVGAELRAQVQAAFAQYYQSYYALKLNEDLGQFTDAVAQLAKTRYETGTASQQDMVKAQLEQAMLQSERYTLQSAYSQSQARINALLNRPAHAELRAPEVLRPLPPPAVLDEAVLEQRLRDSSPQLAGQAAQLASAQGNAELTQKNLMPDFILGMGPSQRGSSISSWNAMLEFTIPLQSGAHHAHRHEADEMLDASRDRQQATTARLLGELRERYAALQAAQQQANVIQQRALPLAELAFQGALAGYQNGRVDFATLLEAKRQLQKTKMDELNARVEQQMRLAEIERLIGEEL